MSPLLDGSGSQGWHSLTLMGLRVPTAAGDHGLGPARAVPSRRPLIATSGRIITCITPMSGRPLIGIMCVVSSGTAPCVYLGGRTQPAGMSGRVFSTVRRPDCRTGYGTTRAAGEPWQPVPLADRWPVTDPRLAGLVNQRKPPAEIAGPATSRPERTPRRPSIGTGTGATRPAHPTVAVAGVRPGGRRSCRNPDTAAISGTLAGTHRDPDQCRGS